MQSIETRYIGATNTKPSRIVARCEAGRIVTSKHHNSASDVSDDHRCAAMELILKLGWHGHWVQGAVPSLRNGYVFVCAQRMEYEIVKIYGVMTPSLTIQSRGPHEGFDVWPGMATQ